MRRVPPARRYYGTLRIPPSFPPRLITPDGYCPMRLRSLPWTRRRSRAWSFRVWQPHANCGQRRTDTLKFPGSPSVPLPCSPTPAGPLRQAIRRSDAAPAAATARAPTIRRLSGLNHTASALAVYASPHGSHRRTQDSLPLSANSTERDFNPQDSYERFLRRFLHRILPCMIISATCNYGGSVVRRSVTLLWLRPLREDCSLRSLA